MNPLIDKHAFENLIRMQIDELNHWIEKYDDMMLTKDPHLIESIAIGVKFLLRQQIKEWERELDGLADED